MKMKKVLMVAAASMLLASCGGGGGRPSFGDNEYPVVTVGTSSTTMQTTYKTFFGEYTDEIIDYCLSKLKRGFYPVYSSYLKKY